MGPGREPQGISAPAKMVTQPIPFSHKRHAQAGMDCDTCHLALGTGEQLQIPGAAECMGCHRSIRKDSPAIQKLAQLEKENQPLLWTRLYHLPNFVFFSHQKHIDANVKCVVCHGAVKDRDNIWQEKDVSMVACVDCHKLRKVSVSCDLCHNIGH